MQKLQHCDWCGKDWKQLKQHQRWCWARPANALTEPTKMENGLVPLITIKNGATILRYAEFSDGFVLIMNDHTATFLAKGTV